jgi:molybdate transport system permease protein
VQPPTRHGAGRSWPALLLALPLLLFLLLPLIALLAASSFDDLRAGLAHPAFLPALWLSLRTTLLSLLLIVLGGLPLSWWLAHAPPRRARVVELLVAVPVVLPPAVVGIALLTAFGRNGLLGGQLFAAGIQLPFTETAVLLAQVTIAAPFFVLAATAAFRRVDGDLLIVARTLGQSPLGAFTRVAVPLAMPGLLGGAALAWARALGEFGATLLFAGNRPGETQTMPLAIYITLESDVRVALALALVLAAASVLLLAALRLSPSLSRATTVATR